MQKQRIDYDALISTLHQFCLEKQTGTLFVSTDDNRSVRFALDNGRIISCIHGRTRGKEAIPLITAIKSGRYSFNSCLFDKQQDTDFLPSTEELLLNLGLSLEAIEQADNHTKTPTTNIPEVTTIPPPHDFLRFIEEQLALLLGPLGSTICNLYAERIQNATSHEDFCNIVNIITEAIGNTEIEEQFRLKIWEQYGGN